ncbi:PAC2 family protein [soil metagenome]
MNPSSDYRLVAESGGLDSPTLIVMLTGWIDASESAGRAMQALLDECDGDPLVEFDDDQYIDFRARRPVMSLRDSVSTELRWSSIEMRSGRDLKGNDVLLLCGPEPDMFWHRFAERIGQLALDFGVSKMVGLGAYPYAVPHTRAPRLSVTTPSIDIRDRMPTRRSSIDLPAGMAAVLEHALHDRHIPAMSLWVQVPHYVASMAYPAATVALIEALNEHADVLIDGVDLRHEALGQRDRLDRLVSSNEEHQAMVEQLERIYDADEDPAPGGATADGTAMSSGPLPSADELAGEIERYLREQGKNP